MSDKKTHAIEYCLGLMDQITDNGWDAVMNGEFNSMYEGEEDLPGLLKAARELTVDEMMANQDVQKELRGLLESLKSAVTDNVEYLAENG